MTREEQLSHDLIDFIHASPCAFTAVRNIKAALLKKGFKQLLRSASWDLQKGGKYFTTKNDSSLVAFVVGSGKIEETGFRIITAHTDSPGLKLKPSPEIVSDGNYLKLNVETYGSPILSTWLDRPLSIAGRVTMVSENIMEPVVKFINIKRPLLVIPSLAIHLNREINEQKSYNKQVDMLPVMCLTDTDFKKEDFLKSIIAKELKVKIEDVLDFDLSLYEYAKGEIAGLNNEFISSSRIDNLSMVHAGIDALFDSDKNEATNIMVCFDNEEVGSMTKQGAQSVFFSDILKRLVRIFGKSNDSYMRAKVKSFGISADPAHAIHPNFPEKHDPVLRPKINGGPVIKINANQKYTTDSVSSAVFEMLCKKAGVPFQKYANRSDVAGGSTLGSVLTTHLDIRMVDVGNAMLAMHSIRELSGVLDHFYMRRVFEEFYKS